ncbi:protein kinase domain-containing protein [Hyalangium gracile]|uniref:protein kinase domain-containing protein n=1 Tax=Hyalangium gracile TaxID=394092 RepID=UPI001CCA8DC0|nr:protein kinase [Hyalangium gracile]
MQASPSVCNCASPHLEAECPTLIRQSGGAVEPRRAPSPVPELAEEGDSFVGQKFGSFQVVRELGRGGMGTVWLAEHALIQKRVAVKVLHAHLARDRRLVSRFLSEARTLTLIQHENVVTLYDLDMREGRPYLVMEHLEGQSLASFAQGPLELALAVDLLSQVCDALGAAHAHGVVHRDLKPANVFLVPGSHGKHRVKLLDFGIAKLLTYPTGMTPTQDGAVLGTPEFMSPEQCGGLPVDARTDLYAVGVMGYFLVTGRMPFTGNHPAEVLMAHLLKAPRLAHEVRPQVPRALSQVLARAMAKRPEDRFASAGELREALRGALAPKREPPPSFTARVRVSGEPVSAELRCERVGRTGLFLHTQSPPPPLLVDVGLLLRLPGGELACTGQVVRHVSPEQAHQWHMTPGFGVQLRDTAPGFQEAFEKLLAGERVAPQTPPVSNVREDERAEAVLQRFGGRLLGDHYRVLGTTWDADFDTVRVSAREARLALEPLLKLTLAPSQRARAERALERVAEAFQVLSHPERRAEYDAELRNLEGVQRCLSAGLTVTALEECRRRFLARNRVPEGHATLHLATGDAFAAQGKLAEALRSYEAALRVDPLHLEALKRWRTVRARLRSTPPSSEAMGR